MGGRGARCGFSKQYNEYGTQYHTVTQAGNIKFVEKIKKKWHNYLKA